MFILFYPFLFFRPSKLCIQLILLILYNSYSFKVPQIFFRRRNSHLLATESSYQQNTNLKTPRRRPGPILPDLSQASFPPPPPGGYDKYDLIVLGSGPAGESLAVHAAKLGTLPFTTISFVLIEGY
jgi:hypothetical protein